MCVAPVSHRSCPFLDSRSRVNWFPSVHAVPLPPPSLSEARIDHTGFDSVFCIYKKKCLFFHALFTSTFFLLVSSVSQERPQPSPQSQVHLHDDLLPTGSGIPPEPWQRGEWRSPIVHYILRFFCVCLTDCRRIESI